MRYPLANVSEALLKAADVVDVIDPRQPSHHVQVFGKRSVPPLVPYPQPARVLNVLEVEMDLADVGKLQDLRRMVQAVKGYCD
jgi:hypothetical protein